MKYTKNQCKQMTKEQLIDELVKSGDIQEEFEKVLSRLDELSRKFDQVNSDLIITKKVNKYFEQKIKILEKDQLNASQYLCREMLELSPIPEDIPNDTLEASICLALSLTGEKIDPSDLLACHRMKKQDRAILKLKDRKKKHNILSNRDVLRDKGRELTELKLSNKLFVSESM